MKPQGGADRLRPFFLDIFSGEEGVAKSLRAKNVAVKTFDIRQGISGDVSLKSTLRRIVALVNSGNCLGIMMHIPCTTCSSARHPALRSRQRPRGLQGLQGRALLALRAANLLYDHCFAILEAAERRRVPWVVENPLTSILWHFREFRKWMLLPHVDTVRFDMCGYGSPWRKATLIMTSRCIGASRLACRCRSDRLNTCFFTGRRHIALVGRDPHGVPWTRRAQVYPPGLCRGVASLLFEAGIAKEFASRLSTCADTGGGPHSILWRVRE